jgi:hypothetical protein
VLSAEPLKHKLVETGSCVASRTKIWDEIMTVRRSWTTAKPAGGKLILLVTSPATKSKAEALDVGIPHVDHTIDAMACDAASVGGVAGGQLPGLNEQFSNGLGRVAGPFSTASASALTAADIRNFLYAGGFDRSLCVLSWASRSGQPEPVSDARHDA